jgi:uncharacterized membrane protein YuzA (DUF378 family)
MSKRTFELLCVWVLVFSGFLWGLVGLFDFNLVMFILGPCWVARVVYFLFGLAAVFVFFGWKTLLKKN